MLPSGCDPWTVWFTPAADLCLAATLPLLSSLVYAAPFEHMHWPRHVEALAGEPGNAFRLTAIYMVGALFYLFRNRVVFRPPFALSAAAVLVGFFVFAPAIAEFAARGLRRLPDVLSRADASSRALVDEQVSRYFLRDLPVRMARREPLDLVPQGLALVGLFRFNHHLFCPRLAKLALRRASCPCPEAKTYGAPACRLSAGPVRDGALNRILHPL